MSKEISKSDETKMIYGYAGRMLRVDLSKGETTAESLDKAFLRKYVGGAAMGIRLVFDEVPPGVEWSDPENRLFFGSGPLGGTRIGGSGCISVATKGALTSGMASSQACGFFGAFLRFAGFDAIIIQGAAPKWVYLYIHDGVAEIRDATHLAGKDTYEVDRLVKDELKKKERETSVLSIGPAGENLVKFACIFTDLGHIAGHNGVGAVMGSKKLKAIAIDRGKSAVPLKDKQTISQLAKEILSNTLANPWVKIMLDEGSVGGVAAGAVLPTKNYTTNIHVIDPDKKAAYSSQNIRAKFKAKRPNPCWACTANHGYVLEIPEGKYAGLTLEEPEYETMAACSSLIDVDDVTMSVVLAREVDRLGIDSNETGYLIAWLMECYEKRLLTKEDTDGLEMTWGNGEAVMAMLNKTAHRQGFGNVLAEGVMRAAQHVGGEATNMAVHSMKGNTVRGHDHRLVWLEMFDTCVSNLGTLETHRDAPYEMLGLPKNYASFGDPDATSTIEAKIKGAMIFEDSLVTCRYQTTCAVDLLRQAVNAATGWDMDFQEAMDVGRRAANLARVYNLRHGIAPELDRPSKRYGSTPLDGRAAGVGIMCHWDNMLANYYKLMGWDEKGEPLPETLKSLGLEDIIK